MARPDQSPSPDAGPARRELAGAGYLADETLVTALYLALALGKPLLLEGVPGVGKTEVAEPLPAFSTGNASACNATKASTPARRSTTGTMRGSFCRCALPNAAARSTRRHSMRPNS